MTAFDTETGLTLGAFLAKRRIDALRVRCDEMATNEPMDLRPLVVEVGYGGPPALERDCRSALGTTPAGYLHSHRRC